MTGLVGQCVHISVVCAAKLESCLAFSIPSTTRLPKEIARTVYGIVVCLSTVTLVWLSRIFVLLRADESSFPISLRYVVFFLLSE